MRSRDEIKNFLHDRELSMVGIVERARRFAFFAHDGQRDRGGKSYLDHITHVASETEKRYGDEILTAIAYMHDTVEDGGFTISDLTAYFPSVVWRVIEILTRDKAMDRAVYIEHISENLLASKVKLIDLEHNMDMSRLPYVKQSDYDRQDRYAAEHRVILDALIDMEKHMSDYEMQPDVYEEFYMGDRK